MGDTRQGLARLGINRHHGRNKGRSEEDEGLEISNWLAINELLKRFEAGSMRAVTYLRDACGLEVKRKQGEEEEDPRNSPSVEF